MVKQEIDLSLVIPCYNEEERLPSTISEISRYVSEKQLRWEIIFVDDGSTDGTVAFLQGIDTAPMKKKVLIFPKNRGKGAAVRFGAINAEGNLLLFADADGATPIEEVERLERAIAQGADIAIGSRAVPSSETKVVGTLHRKIMGRIFNFFVSLIIGRGFADTQCGFKLFRSEVAKKLFALQKNEGFSFDVEILFLARKLGFRISELAINWHDVPRSKVRIVRDSLKMGIDVLQLQARYLLGSYDLKQ